MKKDFNRWLWLVFVVFFPLTGCAGHVTALQMSDLLNQDALYASYDV